MEAVDAAKRSEMFDRALKLTVIDRAELKARKLGRKFLNSKAAPPVMVIGAVAALDTGMRTVEVLFP